MRTTALVLLACCWTLLNPLSGRSAPADALKSTEQALAVLKTHCAACHSLNGKAKGGFDYVLDRDRLVSRQQVLPGRAQESPLFQRIQQGEMPPGKRPHLSADELAILQRWIDSGAVGLPDATPALLPITVAAIPELILKDLQSLELRQQRFMRYLTLTHLLAARVPAEELQRHRHTLAKLTNSLSWHPRIVRPFTVDAAQTIYRIDLRDYRWSARQWERLTAVYPYRLNEQNDIGHKLAALATCEVPSVRGDWFVATVSRPPFYHDFLQLPGSEGSLERQLGVEAATNLREDNALRAGFNGSGVARSNRIIERYDAAHGAYWRSYDFSDNLAQQNIFEHPLGPGAGGSAFSHAGGEIIFHLPNGLQGYMLVDGRGQRLDKAPGEIVTDPKRPDRLVENGLSCLSCHVRGLLPKDDQVRAHVLKNPAAFSPADRAAIKALYVPAAHMKAAMTEDIERFTAALTKAGVPLVEPEPVEAVVLRYEAVLDLTTAAAEAGLDVNEFSEKLRRSPTLARQLGALLARGGTVQRQLFQESFPDLVKLLYPSQQGAATATNPLVFVPFTGHRGAVRGLALSPDGRLAATGGEDRTVRLWDVTTGKERLRLEGHTDEVTAVCFGIAGRVLTGSWDRTVRLWDVQTGQEIRRFQGHTDNVRCLAMSLDGKHVLSGGDDRTVRLWSLASGQEVRVWAGHTAAVTSVALSDDGKLALSGSLDHSLRLWDVVDGKSRARWDGHQGAVYTVAFAPDGRRALSGGNDRLVRLWDVATGRELHKLAGHANAVVSVLFAADGKSALSASSQYRTEDKIIRIWDVEKGVEERSLGVEPGERVEAVGFARDGSQALLSQLAGSVRLLPLRK